MKKYTYQMKIMIFTLILLTLFTPVMTHSMAQDIKKNGFFKQDSNLQKREFEVKSKVISLNNNNSSNQSIYSNLGNNRGISVSFVGDVMMDWSVKATIKKLGPDYPFKQVKDEIVKSDLAVANLETAVTLRNAKTPKQYNFKSDPASLIGIKNAGFDLVSLANNHSMDYKREGLIDTMKNLEKYHIPYVGAGYNSTQAYSSKSFQIKGKNIKILSFSRVLPETSWIAGPRTAGLANGYNINQIVSVIKKEKIKADFVFVYIHWGVETKKHPESFQRDWARRMINAGAEGIIGSHPHVLQGFEYYKGKPIAYSLGNFLFPDYVSGDKAQTGILTLTIENGKTTMGITPYLILKDQIKAQSMASKQKVWKDLEKYSFGVQINQGKIIGK